MYECKCEDMLRRVQELKKQKNKKKLPGPVVWLDNIKNIKIL